jgi:hypothetical protein
MASIREATRQLLQHSGDATFHLTDEITRVTAPHQSATIVTLLYSLPGLLAYTFLLMLVVVNPDVAQVAN